MKPSNPHPYFGTIQPQVHATQRTPSEELRRAWLLFTLPLLLNGFYNPVLASMPALFWTIEILTWAVLPMWLCRNLVRTRSIDLSVIFAFQNPRRILGLAATMTFVLFSICRSADWLSEQLLPDYLCHRLFSWYYTDTMPEGGFSRLLVACYYSISAGLWEELFFRAIPYSLFPRRGMYILCTSLLFALMHFEQNLKGLITVFLFAVAASLFYARFRLIIPLIFAHFSVDFLFFYFDI
ncbi:MAG: CPBP family intramembrane metalloprotease [Leptospirales bacterium]|nr:CPBP family intramembrane metalloprotease [Leptospirales bacterium]